MHRSATSLIARSLHKEGVNMGKVLLPANLGNDDGHFENIEFLLLNDRILTDAGGSWDNPPPESEILKVGQDYATPIEDFIKNAVDEKWGWKDPRTTLTIRCYLPFLKDYDPFFVCCLRKPEEVAKSLRLRDGMPIDEGLSLAKEYNKRLISFMQDIGL